MSDRGCWCENGGTCSTSGLCICPTGFKGSSCQLEEDVSENAISKTLEIIIVVVCIIFFVINGFCWLCIWYKRKQQELDEGISLDTLNRLISVHANRQASMDQHALAMSGIDIPPNYEDYLNQDGLDRSQSTPGTPVILPGYLVSHVRHDLKDRRSHSLPNTSIFVPGYYRPTSSNERGDGDETDSPAFSSPSTPVILPGYMSPVKLSESRSSSPSSLGSPNIANGVLSPLARFWKKTSPGNKSMDHSSPASPVLSVTISPLVTSEVKVDKSQHPSTPTHYNYITTPTKSSRLGKKAKVPKLFIPPHGTTCLLVDQCESAPVFNTKSHGKSRGKSRGKKVSDKTEKTDDSEDTIAMTSLMPETSNVNNESTA